MASPGVEVTNRLQSLPMELQLDIFSHLSYESTIKLSQVNHHFYDVTSPQECSQEDKTAFVKKAEFFERNNRYRDFNLGMHDVLITESFGYACFTCCKVKPINTFSAHQIIHCNKIGRGSTAGGADSRCCVDCSIKGKSLRHGVGIKLLDKVSFKVKGGALGAHVLNHKIRDSRRMRYCGYCKTLHPQQQLGKKHCRFRKSSQKTIKYKGQPRYIRRRDPGRKVAKKPSHDYRVEPTNRICGQCGISDAEMDLGDLWCEQCLTWICWSCARPSHGGPQARCVLGNVLHDLNTGSRWRGVHEKLMRAHRQRTGQSEYWLGFEDRFLSDVGFLRHVEESGPIETKQEHTVKTLQGDITLLQAFSELSPTDGPTSGTVYPLSEGGLSKSISDMETVLTGSVETTTRSDSNKPSPQQWLRLL